MPIFGYYITFFQVVLNLFFIFPFSFFYASGSVIGFLLTLVVFIFLNTKATLSKIKEAPYLIVKNFLYKHKPEKIGWLEKKIVKLFNDKVKLVYGVYASQPFVTVYKLIDGEYKDIGYFEYGIVFPNHSPNEKYTDKDIKELSELFLTQS
jgi:hypothetical protein